MPRRSAAAAAALDEMPLIPVDVPEARHLRVPIDSVVESALNPRKRHDDAALRELAESIALHDILEPIIVREGPFAGADAAVRFEIVAGSRRHRAAKLAGRDTVPVMVRVVTDAQLLELALQENIHRASMSPLEEAGALEQLAALDPIYRNDKILASKIGRSETYVRDRLKLLRLDASVVRALEGQAITAKHAERIARLPRERHSAALRACFSRLFVSDTEFATLVDNDKWADLAPQLVGLRDFDEWAGQHATVDVTAPDALRALRPALAELFTTEHVDDRDVDSGYAMATAEMLRLSEDEGYQFAKSDAKTLGVIRRGDWTEIRRDKDACGFERQGIVVHGGALRFVERVCVDKRHCTKHWPKPKVSKAAAQRAETDAGDRDRAKREQEKAEAERVQWEAAAPAFAKAFGQLVARQKYSPIAVARATLSPYDLKRFREMFGLQLTDKTALALLFVARINVDVYSRRNFFDAAAELGISRKQIEHAAGGDRAAHRLAMALDAPAPKFINKVEATVWRAMGQYQGGEQGLRSTVRKGISDDALEAKIRETFGTGGVLNDDMAYQTRNGELTISKPVKATLSVAKLRAIVRRLASAPGRIGAAMAPAPAKKSAAKKGRKK